MNPEEVIINPILTEKSLLAQANGLYYFWVHSKANKNQIAKAVKILFGVIPVKVRTFILRGKVKNLWRQRKKVTLPKRKKALVQLKAGEKIELLEIKKK